MNFQQLEISCISSKERNYVRTLLLLLLYLLEVLCYYKEQEKPLLEICHSLYLRSDNFGTEVQFRLFMKHTNITHKNKEDKTKKEK